MSGATEEDFQCPFCDKVINLTTKGMVTKHFSEVHGVITKDYGGLRRLLIKLEVVDLPIGDILDAWRMPTLVFGEAKVVRKSGKFIMFQQRIG